MAKLALVGSTSFALVLLLVLNFQGTEFGEAWRLEHSTSHDDTCFTQGFEFLGDVLFESCGLYGHSRIQKLDFSRHLQDSSIPPAIVDVAQLSPDVFAEGLTVADGLLYVLTWKEKLLIVLDAATLQQKRTLRYPLDGWGIAHREGKKFFATDGSYYLYHLEITDDDVVRVTRAVPVFCDGKPLYNLNEMELVKRLASSDDELLLNVWQTNLIYRVNPDTGKCLTKYDLSLLEEDGADVLNGIACHNCSSGTFWITGKLWSRMHNVQF